ncbi:MAG: hypothetical protein KatS3mg110_1042 [Pirellulaceae bacterium]|nr:MAG: hypothetical protein KatS3mg110_1042 [Pirellulaceae bacterium]
MNTTFATNADQSRRVPGILVILPLLVVQTALLSIMAILDAPVIDEYGHLVAGVVYWRYGDFRTYEVNPPLTKLIAALPASWVAPKVEFITSRADPRRRVEADNLARFVIRDGRHMRQYVLWGRLLLLPFGWIGVITCWRWAGSLYGWLGGLLASALWVFSPGMLGHGHLMTADVPAASMSLLTVYLFCRWLRNNDHASLLLWSVALGLALITKFTLVILPVLLVVIETIYCYKFVPGWRGFLVRTAQIFFGFGIAVLIINLGYGFQGTGTRLEQYQFGSRLFAGRTGAAFPYLGTSGNRWAGTWLGKLPLPLPSNYLTGIDAQQCDFEKGLGSYLRGTWATKGWWYYYLYGLLVKEPCPFWVMLALALVCGPRSSKSLSGENRQGRFEETVLLLTALAYLVLVSSKTGFTNHVRYALVVLPPLWVFFGRILSQPDNCKARLQAPGFGHSHVVCVLLIWQIVSTMFCFPHLLSYFNEWAGGPRNGGFHLADSNISWNQDLYRLESYMRKNPVLTTSLYMADGTFIWFFDPPPVPDGGRVAAEPRWDCDFWKNVLATSSSIDIPLTASARYQEGAFFEYIRHQDPVAWIGYSIVIYRVDRQVLAWVCKDGNSTGINRGPDGASRVQERRWAVDRRREQ